MRQRAGGGRFTVEAFAELAGVLVGRVEQEGLEGDGAPDDRVEPAIDDAHGAAAEFPEHAVAANRANGRGLSPVS